MEFQLKGWPAVIAAVVLILGAVGYRVFLHGRLEVSSEAREQLELALMSEIAGDITADTEAIKKALESGDRQAATAIAEGTLERKVEIKGMKMKGSGEKVLVKATYVVFGPDKEETKVGYFQFSHTMITGWQYRREVSSVSWYLTLL
jgi:hypothetical protein